ncbi:MAG: heme-binding protein [Actinomycetota bacterium]|nr:heme-binding protein [Actinomycetota bacterium]
MELAPDFSFQPLPAVTGAAAVPFPDAANPLGPLAGLLASWSGTGFNVIWRPSSSAGQDHFLELNVTGDKIDFAGIPGPIPNRGFLQPDISMFGLTYLQQVSDTNLHAGLHIEPGLWVAVPATSNPKEGPTVARLASIPHGTTIVAQGTATTTAGPPAIPPAGIKPFTIGQPGQAIDFPEQTLATASQFRTSGTGLAGITQAMVNDPNNVLTAAIRGQHIETTTTLRVATNDTPVPGGGTASTAFLKGTGRANADPAIVTATFWLETLQGETGPTQLQYSQTVLLHFNGLSWPHITVGTLRKAASS